MNRVSDIGKRRRWHAQTCEEHSVVASGAGVGLERHECSGCGVITIRAVDWAPSERFRRYVESGSDSET